MGTASCTLSCSLRRRRKRLRVSRSSVAVSRPARTLSGRSGCASTSGMLGGAVRVTDAPCGSRSVWVRVAKKMSRVVVVLPARMWSVRGMANT